MQQLCSPSMEDWQLGCCAFLIVIVSLATGIPCLYYSYRCTSAGERAKHKSDCKNIHNDDSAKALMAFGYIFSIPWIIAVCGCLCCAVQDNCSDNSVSPSDRPSESTGGTVVFCVPV